MQNKELLRYAILFEEKLDADTIDQQLHTIFHEFWLRKVLNIIVIFWTTKLNCITYSPFDERFVIPLNANETRSDHLFYDKAKNMNGHLLKVGLFSDPSRAIFKRRNFSQPIDLARMRGVDGLFTSLVITKMNATIQIIEPVHSNLGGFIENGTANGVLGYLLNDTVDVGLNARFFRYRQFLGCIEVSTTTGRDDLCILVPRAGIISNIGNIFDSFEIPVWILIIIALPLYAFVIELYVKFHSAAPQSMSFGRSLLRFFGWNINQPQSHLPNAAILKCLFSIWIFYSFFITSFYGGNLTSYLLLKPRAADIKTLKEFHDTNYKIRAMSRYADLLNELTINDRSFSGRIEIISEQEYFTYLRTKERKYAYANKNHLNRFYLKNRLLFEAYRQIEECPLPYINVYAFPYGSAYKRSINEILQRVQAAGLYDLWNRMDSYRGTFQRARYLFRQRNDVDSNTHVPISIYHLQSAFYLWLLGCLLSVTVLFIEYTYCFVRKFRLFY